MIFMETVYTIVNYALEFLWNRKLYLFVNAILISPLYCLYGLGIITIYKSNSFLKNYRLLALYGAA